MVEPNWYEGGPTVAPAVGEDAWHDHSQIGRADLDPNNDLSGGMEADDDGAEVQQP